MAQMKFILLFMVCTSLILFVTNSQVGLYEQDNEFLDFFVKTSEYDPQSQDLNFNETFASQVDSLSVEQSGGIIEDISSFIDTVKVVWDFMTNILLGLPILSLIFSLQIPVFVAWLIVIPLYIMYIFGIVEFIRGFSG